MALIAPTVDLFLLSSFVFLSSWLYITTPSSVSGSNGATVPNVHQSGPRMQSHLQTRKLLSFFVALHTVYMLYRIVLQPPSNLFSLLHLPLNESSGSIRNLLLRTGRTQVLPKGLDVLLTRLQSFEAREAYIRFGHSTVQDCDYCTTSSDFGLYALPPPLLEYVRMSVVVGIITIRGSGKEHWRVWALVLLSLAAAAEMYFVLNSEVSFSPAGKQTMVHDTALRLRRVLSLVLPPVMFLVPPRHSQTSPLQVLPDIVARAERTRARLQLLRLTSAARSRHPDLREASDNWWTRQRSEGQSAVNDDSLREMAGKLGIEIDESDRSEERRGLRERARTAVEALHIGFRPRS